MVRHSAAISSIDALFTPSAASRLQRRLVAVGGEHVQAALAGEVAAHRLTHGADAYESDLVCHVSPR